MAEGDGVWQKLGVGAGIISAIAAVVVAVYPMLEKNRSDGGGAEGVAVIPIPPGPGEVDPIYVPPAKFRSTNEQDVGMANGAFGAGDGVMLLDPPIKGPMKAFENEDVILGFCDEAVLKFEEARQVVNSLERGLPACVSVWNKRGGLHSVKIGKP